MLASFKCENKCALHRDHITPNLFLNVLEMLQHLHLHKNMRFSFKYEMNNKLSASILN